MSFLEDVLDSMSELGGFWEGDLGAREAWELIARYGPGAPVVALGVAIAYAGAREIVRRWRHERHARDARVVEIAIPPEVGKDAAYTWWSRLGGLAAPRWKRLVYGHPHVVWEFRADVSGVRVRIWVPGTVEPALVERTARAAWPGATITTASTTEPVPTAAASAGGRLVPANAEHHSLKTTHESDPLRHLLEVMSSLGEGEHAAVQILVRPVTGRRLRGAYRAASALRGGSTATLRGEVFDVVTPGAKVDRSRTGEQARLHPERNEQIRAILAKAAQPRFEAQIVYAVATERRTGPREGSWLTGRAREVASTFSVYTSGHQHLRRRRLHDAGTRLARRRLGRGHLLSAAELSALAHLPYDPDAPGVIRAGARPSAPGPAVPSRPSREVRVLGDADAGPAKPVALSVAAARQHLHVLGATGVGKSTFLANLILSDAHAGRGALVIDPKGDLISDVLDRWPERAIGKTVVFDPMESGPPPCINVLTGPDEGFAAESVVTAFRRCFSSAWGPRLDDVMRSTCLTLTRLHGPGASLAQVPKLLTDSTFRAREVAKLNEDGDGVLKGFWQHYEQLTPAGQGALIGPVMNKLRAILVRPFIQQALSGSTSTVDLGRILNTGGLILARIPKGALGEDATRLFGSLLLAQTWQAITPRASLPEQDRRDATAYVDEAHNFLNIPGSISDILAEARAYRLSLVLAHQHLSQLPKHLQEAVAADARNKIFFSVSPTDARELSHHVAPMLAAHDLSHLGEFQAAGHIITTGSSTSTFTFRTRPLSLPVPGRGEAVRAASRAKYVPTATTKAPHGGRRNARQDNRRPLVRRTPPRDAHEPGRDGRT